jgi:hypothetical protein
MANLKLPQPLHKTLPSPKTPEQSAPLTFQNLKRTTAQSKTIYFPVNPWLIARKIDLRGDPTTNSTIQLEKLLSKTSKSIGLTLKIKNWPIKGDKKRQNRP